MNNDFKVFFRTLYPILGFGLAIIGLIELQRMEYAHKSSDERLEVARRSGINSVQNQAARLGYGRYQDENFVWNTNLFGNFEIAIDSVIKSERKTTLMAHTCLKLAQVTVEAGEVMKRLDSKAINAEDIQR